MRPQTINVSTSVRLAIFLMMLCSTFSVSAKICNKNPASLPVSPRVTVDSAPEPNVSYFVWSAALNDYVLMSSYYDPSITSSYVLKSGEVDVTPTTVSSQSALGMSPQVSVCDPPPPITDLPHVTATPPPSVIGFKPVLTFKRVPFASGGGGGGGRIIRKIVKDMAPDNPNNTNPATCKADSEARWYHAAMDFAAWRLVYANLQMVGRGEVMTISYDGGGTEDYMWIPGRMPSSTAPPETYILQLPGTLDCPK
jgi:hypothetical protein